MRRISLSSTKTASLDLRAISSQYWKAVPLKEIFQAVEQRGYQPVQEDLTPWQGLLTGRNGRADINLAKSGKMQTLYLHLQWYRMESGNYEVTAYIS